MANNSIDAAIEVVVRNKIGLDHPSAAEIISRYKSHAVAILCDGSPDDASAFQKMMHDLNYELHTLRS